MKRWMVGDLVEAAVDLPAEEVQRGTIGTVVHVYGGPSRTGGEGYLVDFPTGDKRSVNVVNVVRVSSVDLVDDEDLKDEVNLNDVFACIAEEKLARIAEDLTHNTKEERVEDGPSRLDPLDEGFNFGFDD